MSRTDGGPAFPVQRDQSTSVITGTKGMSLRDWFAGQALQAIIPRAPSDAAQKNGKHYAKIAYKMANAMLDERAENLRVEAPQT